jgi:hypothetical protein
MSGFLLENGPGWLTVFFVNDTIFIQLPIISAYQWLYQRYFLGVRKEIDFLLVTYPEARLGSVVAGLAEAGSEKFRGQRPRLHQIGSVKCPGACSRDL